MEERQTGGGQREGDSTEEGGENGAGLPGAREGGEKTDVLGLGGMYREVLDTALLTSGPEAERGAGMVTMDTAEVGLVTMDTGLGLVKGADWGGRKQTGVAGVQEGGRPGVKGRAVRFRTPPGLELKLLGSGLMLGLRLGYGLGHWFGEVFG